MNKQRDQFLIKLVVAGEHTEIRSHEGSESEKNRRLHKSVSENIFFFLINNDEET